MSPTAAALVLGSARPERVVEAVAEARRAAPGAEVHLVVPEVWAAAFEGVEADRVHVAPGGFLTPRGVSAIARRELAGRTLVVAVLAADRLDRRHALRLQLLVLSRLRPHRALILGPGGGTLPVCWGNLELGRFLVVWPWRALLAVAIVLLGGVLLAGEGMRCLLRRRRLDRTLPSDGAEPTREGDPG